MIPTWSRKDGFVHLTYELQNRTHGALTYPSRAPNGSTIILVGHDNGLTITWRGGRSFKRNTPKSADPAPKSGTNGKGIDAIMVLDDEEDDSVPNASSAQQQTETTLDDFEATEEDYDISQPYEQVIATHDVPELAVPVLFLAVPSVQTHDKRLPTGSRPTILDNRIVVVVACADGSIRLLTIPLLPVREGQDLQADQHLISEQKTSPRSLPRGLSVTWTSSSSESPNWSLLVASHTAKTGGILTIHQISLVDQGSHFNADSNARLRQEYLSGLATLITFSSAQFPSRNHTQLLITDSKGVIRIYDPRPHSSSHSRQSSQDLKSTSSSQHGVWLASLVPNNLLATSTNATTTHTRNRVLDANWALDGKCIIVLLGDGQWGIWDIEGVASTLSEESDPKMLHQGPVAGSINYFALRGFVGDSVDARSAGYSWGTEVNEGGMTSSSSKDSSQLAPMTPNTRKVKQQRLFSGPTKSTVSMSLIRGGISLSRVFSSNDAAPDERVVMWHGSSVHCLPSLATYWRRVLASSSQTSQSTPTLFGPSIPQMNSVSTGGELITAVAHFPGDPWDDTANSSALLISSSTKLKHDILIAAEHRLVLLCPPKKVRGSSSSAVTSGIITTQEVDNDEDLIILDRDRLKRGELDIGGLDRMLDDMGSGQASHSKSLFLNGSRNSLFGASRKKVGFAS